MPRALIAVADPATRRQLEEIFRDRYTVSSHAEVGDARHALSQSDVSLAVLGMAPDPEASLALCNTISRLPSRPYLLIVAGDDSPDVVRRALGAGADDFVVAPLDRDVVELRLAMGQRQQAGQRKTEAALRRERAFFHQLFHNSPAGIVVLDAEDRVLDANTAFTDLFQFELEELEGRALGELIVPKNLAAEADRLSEQVFARRSVHLETVRQRKDRTPVDVAIVGYPVELGPGRTGAFGLYTDISERQRAARKLRSDALHDPLTGLPNRALLTDRLEHNLRRLTRRPGYGFVLMWVNLDHFKEINDSIGYPAGDAILIETARRLEGCLRPGDTTARCGGDEFALLLEGVREAVDSTRIADRLIAELSQPFDAEGQVLALTASIGLVLGSREHQDAEALIRDAGLAVRRAKEHGKARFELFDEAMQNDAVQRLRLEADLARAVENEEQTLHYQPILSLANDRVVGFEALVRWRHPERGLLGPDELIPACEANGLILPLGRWILQRACLQAKEWQGLSPTHDSIQVGINLSRQQLIDGDFLADLDRIVDESGVKPATIALEVPESVLVDAPEAMALLWQLRRRGFRIHIDDFGTGYTSLRELYRSPVDTLKVDRSFISRMKPGGQDVEVVRAAGALGHALGMTVVAEGVETAQQLAQVRELELTHAQGYYFSRPLPSDEATRWLTDSQRR